MKNVSEYIPEIKHLNNYNRYSEIWDSVYNKRIKIVNENKAVHSANAIVYSEVLKDFMKNKG